MSDQPTGGRYAATIGEQLPAIQSLTALIGMLGTLPAAYIVVSSTYPDRFDLQVETPADFEVWREALQVPSDAVEFHCYGGGSWLALRTVFHGTEVHVTGHGLYVGFEAARVSPAEAAHQWECAAAEQRHQVEDPAVPPLAAAGPVCSGCGEDHAGDPARCKHCTGCGIDHNPDECAYQPHVGPVAPVEVRTLADMPGGAM